MQNSRKRRHRPQKKPMSRKQQSQRLKEKETRRRRKRSTLHGALQIAVPIICQSPAAKRLLFSLAWFAYSVESLEQRTRLLNGNPAGASYHGHLLPYDMFGYFLRGKNMALTCRLLELCLRIWDLMRNAMTSRLLDVKTQVFRSKVALIQRSWLEFVEVRDCEFPDCLGRSLYWLLRSTIFH